MVDGGWGGGRFITHRLSSVSGKGRVKLMYRGQRGESAILMLHQGRNSGG